MNKKSILRFLVTLCMVMALVPLVPQKTAEAASLAAPKVTAKFVEGGKGIQITIGKTKKAEGYEVSISYNGFENLYTEYGISYSKGNLIPIYQDGSKKRSFTVYSMDTMNMKNLAPGKYEIKARSYKREKGKTVYSKFSKSKTLTIKDKSTIGLKESYDFSNVKVGDVISFGAYEQDADFFNGKEALEWIVLSKNGNEMELITKDVIESLPWDLGDVVKWEDCKLRKWLNGSFYENAFNKQEKSLIKSKTISNKNNSRYKTNCGYNTNDKVYILSEYDMVNSNYGFETSYDIGSVKRRSAPSQYIISKGVWQSDFLTEDGEGATGYWLRTLGDGELDAEYVNHYGSVDLLGMRTYNNVGIRPVIVISI